MRRDDQRLELEVRQRVDVPVILEILCFGLCSTDARIARTAPGPAIFEQLPRLNFLSAAPSSLVCVVAGRLSPDTNLDARLASFPSDFLAANSGKQPDWVITSPPYKDALAFVKVALSLAKEGAALKLPLSFLEPCSARGGWLRDNPLAMCIFLRRSRYTRAHRVKVGEFWGVWYTNREYRCNNEGTKLVFRPE